MTAFRTRSGRGRAVILLSALAAWTTLVSCAESPNTAKAKKTPEVDASETDRRAVDSLRSEHGEIVERSKKIKAELQTLADRTDLPANHWAREWAGEYYVGDGTGMNVRICVAPRAGITYTWHGCMGLYDGNYGDIIGEFDDDGDGRIDGLRIRWALRNKRGYNFDPDKYYFIRWNGPSGTMGRRYFVPETKMVDFVNDYNEGGFARDGMYMAPLKLDQATPERRLPMRAQVQGLPQLPARWAKLLKNIALQARVTKIIPDTDLHVTGDVFAKRARVWLDKGRADGVYVGMVAWVGPNAGDTGHITIENIDEHTSEASYCAYVAEQVSAVIPVEGQVITLASGEGGEKDETGSEKQP